MAHFLQRDDSAVGQLTHHVVSTHVKDSQLVSDFWLHFCLLS